MATVDDIVTLEPEVREALARYKALVSAELGDRVKGFYLFGSRARGTHRPDSDADVAVEVDGDFRLLTAPKVLFNAQLEILLSTGLEIQVWPLRSGSLENPALNWAPSISKTVSRDGVAF